MYKLGHQLSGEWVEYNHPLTFEKLPSPSNAERLVCGVPHDTTEVFERLVATLQPPYFLLYVLHTPRGEGAPGRYQSPALSGEAFQGFLKEFAPLLMKDARFDLWVHSPEDHATVVWDRYNQIYCYGAIPRYENALLSLDYSGGEVVIPAPHTHCYHAELDALSEGLLISAYDWHYSPLKPEDEQ